MAKSTSEMNTDNSDREKQKSTSYKQGSLTMDTVNQVTEALPLESALKLVKNDFPIRTIDEVLCEAVGYYRFKEWRKVSIEDAITVLKEKLAGVFLSRWFSGDETKSISKKTAMRIALSLNMTPDIADFFLKRCWLDGFYMRNVEDVIYVFALNNKWSYQKAEEWIAEYKELGVANPDPESDIIIDSDSITAWLVSQYQNKVTDESEFRNFIEDNKNFFGKFRRRLYERFVNLYKAVETNVSELYQDDYEEFHSTGNTNGIENDSRLTVSMNDILGIIGSGLIDTDGTLATFEQGALKRITERIPLRTQLSEIINKYERKGQIPEIDRKFFILTWLSHNDGRNIEWYARDVETIEESFANHIGALNGLLQEFGMAFLDSRHPFDWVIMNAIYYDHNLYHRDSRDYDNMYKDDSKISERLKQSLLEENEITERLTSFFEGLRGNEHNRTEE